MNENELTGLLESLRRMGSDDLNVEVKGERIREHCRRNHRARSE